MRKILLASLALIGLAGAARAQPFPNIPPGETASTAGINQPGFLANTPSQGFQDTSVAVGLTCTGTNQAGAYVITTRLSHFSTCASGAGVLLPPLNRYEPITIMNRGASAMLVYPTVGDKLETAAGTLGAANATYSLAAGADVTFRPIVVNGVVQWML